MNVGLRRTAAALAGLATLVACHRGTPARPSPERAVVFILADLRGYLAPCGCSERMRGGIARAAHQIAEARRSGVPVWVVDGGDSLFDGPEEAPAAIPEVERRARAIAEAFQTMGLAARAVGPRDDARGEAFRRRLGLPELGPGEVRLIGEGNRIIGVVAGQDGATVRSAAARARADGAQMVIALVPRPMEEVARALDGLGDGVDLVVATHSPGELAAEDNRLSRGEVPIVQLQSKGRSLLRLDVVFGSAPARFTLASTQEDVDHEVANLDARLKLLGREVDAPGLAAARKKLVSAKMDELVSRRQKLLSAPPEARSGPFFTARFVPLESSLPSDPAVAAVVERYDIEVGRLNLAWAKAHGKECPPPARNEPAYIGTAACLECHPETARVWGASKHRHAMETLVTVGKQFHTACVGCHVTGYGQPGGVCRIDRVEGRDHVGCESCHGPGSLHADAPAPDNVVAKPAEGRCLACHTTENSPHFDFALYLPKILGPGHGR